MYNDNELKLEYKDVLIRPKRSTLTSRSQVDLDRELTFPHSTLTWKGVPIIAANMDTIGTYEVFKVFSSLCVGLASSIQDMCYALLNQLLSLKS